jgi:probable phosphoglycerate mutase
MRCLSWHGSQRCQRSVEVVSDQSSDSDVEYRQYRFVPPDGATTILLIRHGESLPAREDVPAELTDGHSDPDLDPVGHQQAELIADRLDHEDFAAVYVTTLRRTAQTIAPLADRLGLTPTVEPNGDRATLGCHPRRRDD